MQGNECNGRPDHSGRQPEQRPARENTMFIALSSQRVRMSRQEFVLTSRFHGPPEV
ncbi:hypothetical protein D9M68_228450 [compost metagenome]